MRCERKEFPLMFSLKPNHIIQAKTAVQSKDNDTPTRFYHQYG